MSKRLVLFFLAALASMLLPNAARAQPASHTFSTRYDAMGRVTGTITPDQPDDARFLAVRNSYDAAGRLIRVETGWLLSWQSEAVAPSAWPGFNVYRRTEISYDAMGRKLREELWAQASAERIAVTQYSYDNLGRLTCTAVRMNPAVYGSLPASACTTGTTGAQGPDRISRNVYDAAGQRLQLREGVGTADEGTQATWAYSPNGRVTTVVDGNGNRAELHYDAFDRQDRWTFPSTTRPPAFDDSTPASVMASAGAVNAGDYEQYGYDANGNRTSLRKRDGTVLNYSYDALGRMTVKVVPERINLLASSTRDVFYSHDLRGLQLSARFDSASGEGVTSTYDGFGRQLSSSINMGGVTRTLSYLYDRNGNRTHITHPDSQWFRQDYDQLDQPSWLSWQGSGGIAYINRDGDGQPANINRGNGTSASFSYDGARRLSGMQFQLGGAPNDVAWTYARNPASQLASVTRDNDAYAWTGHYAVARPYTTNGLNQYTQAGTGGGTVNFTYDGNGNLISDGARAYLYDIENRLIQVTGAQSGYFVYDPLGRIFEYTGGGSVTRQFLYDGDALVAEYNVNAGGVMLRRYVHSVGADVPVLWYEGTGLGDPHYLYPDHQGSIVAVSGPSSVAINRYDEYGIPQGNISGRFAYTGQVWLPEIGLYHYKARVYSPTLGRFLQVDPIGYDDQINLYAYVGNDPVNNADPTGEAITPETIWDVANVAMGIGSMVNNVRQGNYGAAFVDGIGVIIDSAATATPVIPGGAAAGLRAARGVDRAVSATRGAERTSTLRPGPRARESVPAHSGRPTAGEQSQINDIGNRRGCHTCGSRDPGRRSRNWTGDHQPPSALNPAGAPQRYYPHCARCSARQGGEVRQAVRERRPVPQQPPRGPRRRDEY